ALASAQSVGRVPVNAFLLGPAFPAYRCPATRQLRYRLHELCPPTPSIALHPQGCNLRRVLRVQDGCICSAGGQKNLYRCHLSSLETCRLIKCCMSASECTIHA